ncbi:MAG: proton-conducting transporter membrane subunit [Gemmataceae bacterium]
MNVLPLPLFWLECAILVALVGALCISRIRDPLHAWRWGLLFTGATFGCSLLACLGFYLCRFTQVADQGSWQPYLFGRRLFGLDELSAPLIPLVALLHFLTALATGRTKMRRFSLSWSLSAEALRLATFASQEAGLLIGLLAAGTVPAYVELLNRGQPTRLYLLHMGLFVSLMLLGWVGLSSGTGSQTQIASATVALLAAMLIRCGTVPVHCWLTDWFEHASLGNALLFVTPLTGVYAMLRLVLPIAPDWVPQSIGVFSLMTAFYAAGMAVVQKDARRFFAFLFLSHASLVLVGMELHTVISLTGALALWVAGTLSLTGLGLTLRALEARFGRLSLAHFHGLYDHSPALAVCFLMTGLASVGFPGTLGFVATELLVEGAVQANPLVGLVVALVATINGIAIVRVYFRLFTGACHASTVALGITPRERFAVLTLAVLILGGGLLPQPGIFSRYQAAMTILRERENRATTASYPTTQDGIMQRRMR